MKFEFHDFKRGHIPVLNEIYSQHSRRLFWIGMNLINDSFMVDSLLQDAFLKLWVKRDSIQSPDHIFNFLRFVITRECITYFTSSKTKFIRKLNSLEAFDNYQEYMAGYDPEIERANYQAQEQEQQAFDKVKKVLPLLDSERRHLITLCLENDFKYKFIAQLMGRNIQEIYREVNMAIEDIKKIIKHGANKRQPALGMKIQGTMTEEQAEVLKLRCEKKYSFAAIASQLNLSQKEVHHQFMTAYKVVQQKHQQALQSV
ncbi:sigma-70 family RNA polymerase sigma factor [Fulvivirga maritima]|uniref:RNA polymerase sigma factor n=1 Tax=Fulvivirga maritima TaxID=2904247 RepID=UPI001F3F499D|nr:sigma-70 family RNA polymerase sigma factor [Fulvivirga maritima]UII27618.1 sigma-70 family RNA polymerase sigma factor [Fulvivirga maritima]